MAERKIRSFIAIQLPQELRLALRELAAPLQVLPLNIKWVPESNYHLTLKFLGDIAPDDLHGLTDHLQALTERDSFSLSLGGWGMFPDRKHPGVIWVGLGGDLEALQRLWKSLDNCLQAGGYPGDPRWHPHITLGRFRSRDSADSLIARLQQTPAFDHIGSFTVTGLDLMESRLSTSGPSYHPLSSFGFKK